MVKQRDRKGQAEAFEPSLRAKRSNPSRGPKKEWIASSLRSLAQTLLRLSQAMTTEIAV
jgi:hypothetical protein